MSTLPTLAEIRKAIDAVDSEILTFIEKRARLSLQVAKVKQAEDANPVYYRPEREAQLLREKIANYSGALLPDDIIKIFRGIMSACRSLQQQQSIAFLGPLGTFSHAAVLQQFGHSTQLAPVIGIKEVFRAVENDQAVYGVVPIENSTSGTIPDTLNMFLDTSLTICGELILPIQFHVLVRQETSENIKTLYAHKQAQLQCSDWLSQQTHLDVVTVSSNAKAAEKAASDKYGAALAGDLAADHYQLQRLHQNVENDSHNFTRFVVLGKQKTPPSGKDKTSLLIASANEPGELFKVLEPLAKEKINMTLIESHRYRHQQWRYMFFIDIDGHVTEEPVKKALSQLEKQKLELTVLGSYPKALLADESF